MSSLIRPNKVFVSVLGSTFLEIFYVGNRICRLPWWLSGKESACNADVGSITEMGRSLREGNGNPLQYACLEHPIDRGNWQASVHGVIEELDTT